MFILNTSRDLEVLWIAKTKYPMGSELEVHSHQEYFQIHYILEGDAAFCVDGVTHPVARGSLVFLHPGVSHGLNRVGESSGGCLQMLECKFLPFHHALAYELGSAPRLSLCNAEMHVILNFIFEECIKKDSYYKPLARSSLYAFLMLVLRMGANDPQGRTGADEKRFAIVSKIQQYIAANYAENVSLDELAGVAGYTKNYLCRVFKDIHGDTINHYLNQVRVHQAAKLLTETEIDLTAIAKAVGYNSTHHFVKTFKKISGITPGSFRVQDICGSHLVPPEVQSQFSIFATELIHKDF